MAVNTPSSPMNAASSQTDITAQDLMSFSPADIQLYMGGRPVGSVLSITYSITREVVALFGLGDANAMGFNRGKRGIAGSLVMNTFQSHPLLRGRWAREVGLDKVNTLQDFNGLLGTNTVGSSAITSVGSSSTTATDGFTATLDNFAFQTGTYKLNTNPNFSGGTFNMTDRSLAKELQEAYDWVKNRKFNYVDQLPPFDIVLTFVNEMGMAAVMSINEVILANEGGGFSVDDITSETAFTYIARSITPMKAFVPNNKMAATAVAYSSNTNPLNVN